MGINGLDYSKSEEITLCTQRVNAKSPDVMVSLYGSVPIALFDLLCGCKQT